MSLSPGSRNLNYRQSALPSMRVEAPNSCKRTPAKMRSLEVDSPKTPDHRLRCKKSPESLDQKRLQDTRVAYELAARESSPRFSRETVSSARKSTHCKTPDRSSEEFLPEPVPKPRTKQPFSNSNQSTEISVRARIFFNDRQIKEIENHLKTKLSEEAFLHHLGSGSRIKTKIAKFIKELGGSMPEESLESLADRIVSLVLSIPSGSAGVKSKDTYRFDMELFLANLQSQDIKLTAVKTEIKFEVENIGKGTFVLYQHPANFEKCDKILAFVSHGYHVSDLLVLDSKNRQGSIKRSFAFVIPKEKSLFRPDGDLQVYPELMRKFSSCESQKFEVGCLFPNMTVYQHSHREFNSGSQQTLATILDQGDMVILTDFEWNAGASYFDTPTPHLADIFSNCKELESYNKILMLTCRTPWSANAGVEKSDVSNQIMPTRNGELYTYNS